MEYYIISLILTIIIFGIIQFYEYNKYKKDIENSNLYFEPYSIFTMNNLLLLIILYIVITISCYYLNISKFKFFDNICKISNITKLPDIKKGGNDINNEIDPKILAKINDNFDVGFEPFTSDLDNDTSSISSLNSTFNTF